MTVTALSLRAGNGNGKSDRPHISFMSGSSQYSNLSEKDRIHAILDFCERNRRSQLPHDLDDTSTDGPVLKEAMLKLGRTNKYLMSRAAANTTPEFRKMINCADSMRLVSIDPASKDGKRLKEFKCDACGRKEQRCAWALDIAGKNNDIDFWCHEVDAFQDEFDLYLKEYEKRFTDKSNGILECDVGRFYVGKTCMRKAILQFMCSTMVQDLLYNMHHKMLSSSESDLQKPELLWVDELAVDNLKDSMQEIQLCIADERRPIPFLCIDNSFWNIIEKHRKMEHERTGADIYEIMRNLSSNSLEYYKNKIYTHGKDTDVESEDDDHCGFCDGSDYQEDDVEDDVEDEPDYQQSEDEDDKSDPPVHSPAQSPVDSGYDDEHEDKRSQYADRSLVQHKKHGKNKMPVAGSSNDHYLTGAAHGRKKRTITVESDDEEEDDVDKHQACKRKAAVGKGPCKTHASIPSEFLRRSSRSKKQTEFLITQDVRARTLEEEEEEKESRESENRVMLQDQVANQDDGSNNSEDEMEVQVDKPRDDSSILHTQPTQSPLAPAQKSLPVRAVTIARSMRIPNADGSDRLLGSRKSTLLDLMDVQRIFTMEERHDEAAKVSRAILTFQELLQIASRQ